MASPDVDDEQMYSRSLMDLYTIIFFAFMRHVLTQDLGICRGIIK